MRPVLRLHLVALVLCVVALLHAGAGAGLAEGNTLYVKKSGNDAAACSATQPCATIRHAVQVAASGDTISVGVGQFTETGGLHVDKDLTIKGGAWFGTRVSLWIDPTVTFTPVFFIEPDVTVTLKNMTITGGSLGGVENQGTLIAENLFIWKNTGQGGIFNTGSLSTTNVAIEGNAGGAGLTNYGDADVFDTHIDGSSRQGTLAGVGVENRGMLTIDRGLIAANQGAGLLAGQLSGSGCPSTVLKNVTITGNGDGGVKDFCGSTTLTHVTIAGNQASPATLGGGIFVYGLNNAVALRNSIVAQNGGATQCSGSVSATNSLSGDNTCIGFPTPGNLVGVDPKLGGLSYQGGSTITRLVRIGAQRVKPLLKGSPAIDAASADYCIPYDQLGQPRPVDGNGDFVAKCDMGAFEYRPPGIETDR
jgi:hypothetical protein